MSSFRLNVQCCFCGGSIEMDEASRTTRCSHCASALRIAREGGIRGYYVGDDTSEREIMFLIDRHLKKTGEQLPSRWAGITRLYLPFWRINAIAFSTIERTNRASPKGSDSRTRAADESPRTEVKIAPKEISFCANESFAWGVESLGVRTQIVRLDPLDSQFYDSGQLQPLTIDLRKARDRFRKTIESSATAASEIGSSVYVTAALPECTLIYFPIWLARFTSGSARILAQFDPVAKRVVSMAHDSSDMPANAVTAPFKCDSIQVMPHRCPNCGQDLPESEKSVTYHCTNCGRIFVQEGLKYKQLKLRVPLNTDRLCRLFPFWVFDLAAAEWSGKGDLLQALSLIGFNRDLFFVPAFEIINPSKLLRLVSHYNRRKGSFTLEKSPTCDYSFTDVTVTPEQAAQLIVPLTAAIKTVRGYKSSEVSAPGEAAIQNPDLVWLPYRLDRYFWREQITGAAIEKAAVRI